MIKQIGLPLRGRPILLITPMIIDRIGLHSVLLPLFITNYKLITNPVVITYHVDFYYKSGWYYTSCCLLQIRVISTTTFCLKDLTLGSQFVVLLLRLVSLVPYKPHTICPNRWGEKTQPRKLEFWVMRLLKAGSLQQSLRNLVIPRQPVRIIDLNKKSSPYILTFTSPSSRKRDSQLVFPMPAIGNSANNDFVTHRGQIQVVIMDWNCR